MEKEAGLTTAVKVGGGHFGVTRIPKDIEAELQKMLL
jgi:hypothetical protein